MTSLSFEPGLMTSTRCSGGTAAYTRPASSRGEVAVDQGQQQAADVRAVDVGVGHEDDLAVAGLIEVEAAARAGTDHLDDRRALGVLEHVGQGRLLDVEDLAADRQQGLVIGVARRSWPCRGRCRPRR
jgi:hypothetical protein